MPKITGEYLNHILEEITFLLSISQNTGEEKFSHDEILKRASVRSLEVIGEAVKALPLEFREINSEVEWKSWAGLRDKLIHHYFGVDYEIIWDIIVNEMPQLKIQIEKCLR